MADGHLKWRRPPGIARECITDARKRILRAADHLGYRVNRLAQSLINARSNVIGLVGTDLQQPFHAELLTTALRGAARGGPSMHAAQCRQRETRHKCADRAGAALLRSASRRWCKCPDVGLAAT
jgi:DNA-binding LacI/PurR family transcriptional regulator